MEQNKEIDCTKKKVKIVFLGDRSVGKSSIINQYVLNKFDQSNSATIGVDFMTKTCKFNNSKYKLQLWDTAGQQKYRSLIKGYIKGATACVFVYDCSVPKSYVNLIDWIKTYEDVAKNDHSCLLIFGNKIDIGIDQQEMEKIKAKTAKKYPKISSIYEIMGSAKQSININSIFEQILQEYESKMSEDENTGDVTIGAKVLHLFGGVSKSKNPFSSCCGS